VSVDINMGGHRVIAPPQTQTLLTLKTTHGFLIQSNDSDVIQIGGNTDDFPIMKVYSNIMMNSCRILNLPIDSHKQLITVWAKDKGTVND